MKTAPRTSGPLRISEPWSRAASINMQDVKQYRDGSVDLCFGPKAPGILDGSFVLNDMERVD